MATRQPPPPEDDPNAEPAEPVDQARSARRPPQNDNGEDPGAEANSPVIINR